MPRHALVHASATALLLASLTSACTGTAPTATPTASAASLPTARPVPTASPFVVPASLPAGTVGVDIGGETNGVTICAGSVWVAYYKDADLIAQIDPATGSILGLVEGGLNTVCLDGQPWVAVSTAIQHIDPTTRAVLASVPVDDAYYVGIGAGSVWTASKKDVVRIDPATGTIVATIPIGAGFDVTEVDGNDDAIWATVKLANTVFRIDPATNTVVAKIRAGLIAHGIVVQSNAIWISNADDDTVTRIDPVTNAATTITGTGSGVGLAEGAGFIWASRREGDLNRIDPKTNIATLVGHVDGWPYGIGFVDDVLWVTDGTRAVFGVPIDAFLPST